MRSWGRSEFPGRALLYDGVPCTPCNPVKAGETVDLPESAVYGHAPARTSYRETWWQAGTAPDGSPVPVYPQGVSISR